MQERKPGCICELIPETGEPVDPNYGECPVHRSDAPDPKKFASDYIKMFEPHQNWDDYDSTGKWINHGKLSALKMVDEIILVLGSFQTNQYGKVLIPFYQKVKEEINAL
jgi:hypothetical protein